MKRIFALVLTLAMALSLAACGGTDQPADNTGDEAPATDSAGTGSEVEELTINLYNPVAGTVTDNSYTLFAERVSELSGGKITCNITPAGTLGAEREATQLLMMGDIDMGVFSIDGLEWLVPNVGMYWVSLPGLLNSFEEVDEYYNNGWMFQRHKEVAAENGIDLICPGEFGIKVFLGTGEPIRTMEDFKGKVIRIPDIDMNHDYISALGAMPVRGIDMYTGLQDAGIETIYDDRDVRPGAMFSDADLIGAPIRVVVSPRNLKESKVEITTRDKAVKEMVDLDKAKEYVIALRQKLFDDIASHVEAYQK